MPVNVVFIIFVEQYAKSFLKKITITGNLNISRQIDLFITIVKPTWACHHPPGCMIYMTHHV